jgi:hypothetical protein
MPTKCDWKERAKSDTKGNAGYLGRLPVPELPMEEIEAPEVGDDVLIDTPLVAMRATWLGKVSNGKELAEAMRLMAGIMAEREGAAGNGDSD